MLDVAPRDGATPFAAGEVLPGNGLVSTLANSVLATDTTLHIQAGDAINWPASGTYRAVLCQDPLNGPFELVMVTGGQGSSTLQVTRAAESYNGNTTAYAWPVGTSISAVLTHDGLGAVLGSGGLTLPLTQNLTFSPDNTYDIGASAASRPRNIYAAGSVVAGGDVWATRFAASSDTALQSVYFGSFGSASVIYSQGDAIRVLPGLRIDQVGLFCDAVDVLAQRNGISPQTLRIYDTYTDANNYSRVLIGSSGGWFRVQGEQAGTGSSLAIGIGTTGGNSLLLYSGGAYPAQIQIDPGQITFGANAPLHFSPDNTIDIGASGSNRPRDLWLGRNLSVAGTTYLIGNVAVSNNGNPPQTSIAFYVWQDLTLTATGQSWQALLDVEGILNPTSSAVGLYLAPQIDSSILSLTNNYGIQIATNNASNAHITNQYGVYIGGQDWANSDYAFGLYVESMTGGNINGAAIYSGGPVHFDAPLSFGAQASGWSESLVDLSPAAYWIYSGGKTTYYGVRASAELPQYATVAGIPLYAQVKTRAYSFTMASAYGVYVDNALKGTGSSITSLYGVYIVAQTGGTSTNLGLYNLGTSEFDGNIGLGVAPITTGTSQYTLWASPLLQMGGSYARYPAVIAAQIRTPASFSTGGSGGPGVSALMIRKPVLGATNSITNIYAMYVEYPYVTGVTITFGVYLADAATAAPVMADGDGVQPLSVAIPGAYGVYVGNQGNASVQNAYGLYIMAQSGASSNNIGIYNGGTTQLVGGMVGNLTWVTDGGGSIGGISTNRVGQINTNMGVGFAVRSGSPTVTSGVVALWFSNNGNGTCNLLVSTNSGPTTVLANIPFS